jgi:hypothetical protein
MSKLGHWGRKQEEITLKNTKSEILDALNAALEREKNLAKMKYEPEKEAIQNKLDQAYSQIKEMATKTVEATGGLKILANNSNDVNK